MPSSLPPWATTQWDVSLWYDTLAEFGVDEQAMNDLVLLSQFTPEGALFANKIVGSFLKKLQDNLLDEIDNKSAFCMQAVKRAVHHLALKHDVDVWR